MPVVQFLVALDAKIFLSLAFQHSGNTISIHSFTQKRKVPKGGFHSDAIKGRFPTEPFSEKHFLSVKKI